MTILEKNMIAEIAAKLQNGEVRAVLVNISRMNFGLARKHSTGRREGGLRKYGL
jgi:hypothetical protein